MPISIIQADITDLHQIAKLFDLYRQFYKADSDINAATFFLEERFIHQESVIFIALNEVKEVVGFVQLYPIFSSVSMKKLWLLNDLFVITKYRKQKIGYQLILKAKEFAVLTKAKGLMLQTEKINTQAQKLYEQMGFVLDNDCVYNLFL